MQFLSQVVAFSPRKTPKNKGGSMKMKLGKSEVILKYNYLNDNPEGKVDIFFDNKRIGTIFDSGIFCVQIPGEQELIDVSVLKLKK